MHLATTSCRCPHPRFQKSSWSSDSKYNFGGHQTLRYIPAEAGEGWARKSPNLRSHQGSAKRGFLSGGYGQTTYDDIIKRISRSLPTNPCAACMMSCNTVSGRLSTSNVCRDPTAHRTCRLPRTLLHASCQANSITITDYGNAADIKCLCNLKLMLGCPFSNSRGDASRVRRIEAPCDPLGIFGISGDASFPFPRCLRIQSY